MRVLSYVNKQLLKSILLFMGNLFDHPRFQLTLKSSCCTFVSSDDTDIQSEVKKCQELHSERTLEEWQKSASDGNAEKEEDSI